MPNESIKIRRRQTTKTKGETNEDNIRKFQKALFSSLKCFLNNKVHDDFDYNIREAAELIQYEYIENRDPSFTPVRQENAVRWCEARN